MSSSVLDPANWQTSKFGTPISGNWVDHSMSGLLDDYHNGLRESGCNVMIFIVIAFSNRTSLLFLQFLFRVFRNPRDSLFLEIPGVAWISLFIHRKALLGKHAVKFKKFNRPNCSKAPCEVHGAVRWSSYSSTQWAWSSSDRETPCISRSSPPSRLFTAWNSASKCYHCDVYCSFRAELLFVQAYYARL